jgi:hypothetical protein
MKSIFLMILFSTSLPFWAKASYAVGNGGGFSLCSDQILYSYDYLISGNSQNIKDDFLASDLKTSLERVSFGLKRLNDPLFSDFDVFLKFLFQAIPGSKYQWTQKGPLRLMYEPDLDANLPRHCRLRKQAVYFFPAIEITGAMLYVFDQALISQVLRQNNGVLQVSYLIVHEWLWNFFGREGYRKVADLNRILHSKQFLQMTPQEFQKYKPVRPPLPNWRAGIR